MSNKNRLGRKIKQFREFRQISREDLALNTNLDKKQIERIEEKETVP